jgi:plastocyanin
MRRSLALLLSLAALVAVPASASAARQGTAFGATAQSEVREGPRPGVQRLHYEFGPIDIAPGANSIEFEGNGLKPDVPGWIVGFKPDLVYTDGEVPRVDVIHLHHGVWLSNLAPLFAAGEEKTVFSTPEGYGWRYDPSDSWVMNHMIHNLTPRATQVYITYDLDFIPAGSPASNGIQDVRTVWLDVMGISAYPVFDVHKGKGGRDRRYTYPDEARGLGEYSRNRWVAQEDGVLVGTGGHLHPGGLWTDLKLTRDGRTVPLFRSEAKYFEPAGAVSWDVAMTVTPPSWRVGVRKGDVLSISATYDTSRSSWYESMGIMPLMFSPGGTGPDPFAVDVNVPGRTTHGPLRENRNHGGPFGGGLPDPRRLLSAPPPARKTVRIGGFVYGRGDLGLTGRRGRPPTIRRGQQLRFVNRDAKRDVMHTITSCKAPCNGRTGIAYPLADGKVRFDSGNLAFGPAGLTAAAQRITWKTPKGLRSGTYTYFCRVHPFMRGAFRVAGKR